MQSALARKWLIWGAFVVLVVTCLALIAVVTFGFGQCSGYFVPPSMPGTSTPRTCANIPDWLADALLMPIMGGAFWALVFSNCLAAIWLLPPAIAEAVARLRKE